MFYKSTCDLINIKGSILPRVLLTILFYFWYTQLVIVLIHSLKFIGLKFLLINQKSKLDPLIPWNHFVRAFECVSGTKRLNFDFVIQVLKCKEEKLKCSVFIISVS